MEFNAMKLEWSIIGAAKYILVGAPRCQWINLSCVCTGVRVYIVRGRVEETEIGLLIQSTRQIRNDGPVTVRTF